MKLAASINLFDGEELLESSLLSLRKSVDYISIVYQKRSYYDEECHPYLEEYLELLKSKNLCDCLFLYDKEFIKEQDKTLFERDKRNIGIDLAKKNGCDYFISIDVDEFYSAEQMCTAKKIIENESIDMSAVYMFTYVKFPIYRFCTRPPYHYIPFIMKIKENTYHKNSFWYAHVDPTRIYDNNGRFYLFSPSIIACHHYNTIRNNLKRKFNNSSINSKINLERKKQFDNYCKKINSWIPNQNPIKNSKFYFFDQNTIVEKTDNFFKIKIGDLDSASISEKDYTIIKNSIFFDPQYYYYTYKDIYLNNYDPVIHFIKIGDKENKNPSMIFNTRLYKEYFNLNENFNTLLHFYKSPEQISKTDILNFFNLNPLIKNNILTHHYTLLYIYKNQLYHSNIFNHKFIYVKYKIIDSKICLMSGDLYINFTDKGFLVLENDPCFFDLVINSNNTISIKIDKKFLSAFENGNCNLMPWNRAYEEFYIFR